MNGLIKLGIYILEGMFLIGIVGATLVLILSAIEDVRTLVGHDAGED